MNTPEKAYKEMMTEARAPVQRRIKLPKLGDPITPDAIKLLSKVKQAKKINGAMMFSHTLQKQKYFSASQSHAYDNQYDFKKRYANPKSIILKDVGDLVAAWDDVANVGYIIPSDSITEGKMKKLK